MPVGLEEARLALTFAKEACSSSVGGSFLAAPANRPKRAREDGVSYGRDAPEITLTAARLAPSSLSLAVAACVAVVLLAVHSVLLLYRTVQLFPPPPAWETW